MSEYGYSFWSRCLHKLALSKPVAEMSFDIERARHLRKNTAESFDERHVFVAGLARAGTTILMRNIYSSNAFRSLTYRDMPFALAPNSWAKISNLSRKDKAAEMRAHDDGILVDFDSPEAIEEVFWRVACGPDYIRDDRLVPMSADRAVLDDFHDYISLLLLQNPTKRYLSKNNNNILRLASLARCFPKASIIIPFRDPIQQAHSLMRQHQAFWERHRQDRFSKQYMNWLVHHEFGQDHRPFVFEHQLINDFSDSDPKTDLNYWLQIWTNTYSFIRNNAPENCIFLSYETMCNNQNSIWPSLCSQLEIPQQEIAEPMRFSSAEIGKHCNEGLVIEADMLYKKLRNREAF